MNNPTALLTPYRLRLLACLIVLIVSVYLFTYNGSIESNDTRTLFNAASSLVQQGDLLLDKTAWYNEPSPLTPVQQYPLVPFDAELFQAVLSAPLMWLGTILPGIGLVHIVWLFNILIGTAICVVMFLYVLTLGYSERTAVLATLVLSFTTIIWPYSVSYFREPSATLMILLTCWFIERWRAVNYRSLWRFILCVLAFIGALLAKESAILSLPAFGILLLPTFKESRRWHRVFGAVLLLIVIVTVLFFLLLILASPAQLLNVRVSIAAVFDRTARSIRYIQEALHTYLFSIGGSVWGTSPVGLLAIPGLWLLYRQRKYRYIWVVIALVTGFVFGYAILRGRFWFGGLSWPPRFLVPVVPFLIIAALPVLDRVFQRPLRKWLVAVVGIIILYGLWIQVTAVSLDWGAYNAALPPEANGLGEWGGGLNLVRYLRWVLIPTLWSKFPLDFIWVRTGNLLWPAIDVALTVFTSVYLWKILRNSGTAQPINRFRKWVMPLTLLLLPLLIYISLRSVFFDPLYLGDNSSLHDFLPIIKANTQPGDVLLLADNNYEPFFLNYDKSSYPRVVALPDQPGERSFPDETPQIVSTNPDALLDPDSVPLLNNLAAAHNHLWLLADSSSWIPWSVRPVERFIAAHYYPIRELSTDPADPRLRMIEYSTVVAPDPFAFRQPDNLTNLRFGESIRLTGFSLPLGVEYQPGDILPISFYWQSDAALTTDYTVAWFIADESGSMITQGMDTPPAWGFAPTSTWQAGVPVWDNRALRLPADMKAGNYVVWLKLYQSDSPANVLPVSGETTLDNGIAVLPLTLRVSS